MRTPHLPQLSLVTLVWILAGCGHPSQRLTHYRAMIERIEGTGFLPVQHYTPEAGPTTVTRLRLRVSPLTGSGRTSVIEVLATGLRAPGELGQPGDVVSFDYPGLLPGAGEVRIEALRDFRVERRAGTR